MPKGRLVASEISVSTSVLVPSETVPFTENTERLLSGATVTSRIFSRWILSSTHSLAHNYQIQLLKFYMNIKIQNV